MRRVIKLGKRIMTNGIVKGMVFPQGHIIQEWDEALQDWVYVIQCHPDDTEFYLKQ